MPSDLNTKPPFACTSGPQDASVVVVGEAFGKDEELLERPFIGASGQELTRLLREAGFQRSELLLTNVLALRPPDNKIEALCTSKKELPNDYSAPAISHGKYLRPEFLPELLRLKEEILAHPRNLVVALGNTACWALLGSSGIGSLRGVVASSTLCPPTKVLPTYHPAAVLRSWHWRPIMLADLLKAKRESSFAEIVRPSRELLVDPTLQEIAEWKERYAVHASALAVDIETKNGQITDIGFASSPSHAICITLCHEDGTSPWATDAEEHLAWNLVEELLMLPCQKIMQNGLYDMQYLLKAGFRVVNAGEDTMLLHHALYPEMQKGLAFLSSIYGTEANWKMTYRKSKKEATKKDD